MRVNPLEIFSWVGLPRPGLGPGRWQLSQPHRRFHCAARGEHCSPKRGKILFLPVLSSLWGYGWTSQPRGFPDVNRRLRFAHGLALSMEAEPAIPGFLLGCLTGFRLPLSTCCQSKKLRKLKWNPSICLCGSKLRGYGEKMSLAFDKAALEMPLSAGNRLEPSALLQEPICWLSP